MHVLLIAGMGAGRLRLRPDHPLALGGGNAHRRPAVLSTADIVNREGKRNPARGSSCGALVAARQGAWVRAGRGSSAGELVDGGLGDGGEEVDEVAVGIAEQQRPVAPRHRGGLVDEVLDEAGQVLVHAVHIVDEELDDDGVVVGRPCGAGREQRNSAGAGDREGGGVGGELGEVLVRQAACTLVARS
jgi:hypothetical protein